MFKKLKTKIPEDSVTINQAAEITGLHPETIRRNIKIGNLEVHYLGKRQQLIYKTDLKDFIDARNKKKDKVCFHCGRPLAANRYINGQLVCSKHYKQFKRHGEFLDNNPRTVFDPNEFHILEDRVLIDLYNSKNEVVSQAIVDLDDFEKVKDCKWRLCGTGKPHIVTGQAKDEIRLAHLVLGTTKDELNKSNKVVDHRSGDPLDNRKENLRIISQFNNSQNLTLRKTNKTDFAGVCYREAQDEYDPYIQYRWLRVHFKRFKNKKEAVYCRYVAEQLLFDEFARQDEHLQKAEFTKDLPRCSKDEIRELVVKQLQRKGIINDNLQILPNAGFKENPRKKKVKSNQPLAKENDTYNFPS